MVEYDRKYNNNLKALQMQTDDLKTTQNMVYNTDFWKYNVVIKRTAKEEEAIKKLEKTSITN